MGSVLGSFGPFGVMQCHFKPFQAISVLFWPIFGPQWVPEWPQGGPTGHIIMYYTHVLGSFGAFQGNIWSVAPFIPVGNIPKNTKKWFLPRTPTKYLNSYIFWTGSSRPFRKGRTLDRDSQLHLGPLQHHCVENVYNINFQMNKVWL